MKNVLIRLQECEANATNTEASIIRYLLSYPDEAAGCSIHRLAELTFSSPSTIIRLCRKIGFSGYKELQKSFLYELAIKKENHTWKQQEIKLDDSLEEIINKVFYKNIASLEDTRKLIDLEILEQCVCLLEQADSVRLFGIGSSLLIARDMYLKLLRVNKSCYVSDDWHSQLLQARHMTGKDLAIIFSYSGMTEEMITCAKEVKSRGAPIILISRFEDSPLARLANFNLAVAAREFIFRSGAMASRISQLAIIDVLYTLYVQRNYEHSLKQFEKTHIYKPDRVSADNNQMEENKEEANEDYQL